MKSTTEKKEKSLGKFLKRKIKNPEAIMGGTDGPIVDKDKIRSSERR